MHFPELNRIIFQKKTSIRSVLKRFDETAVQTEGKGFAIIVDKNQKCIGVVSEGDIRSGIIKNLSIDSEILLVMNTNYLFVSDQDSSHQILRQFDKRVSNLPVLNLDGIPVDLYRYSDFVVSKQVDQKIIRARVPVRISFSGGGTDISAYFNNFPSIVLCSTINKYCTASVIVRSDCEIHIISKDLNISYIAKCIEEIKFGDDLDLIKSAIKIMEPNFGFNLETFAEFEPGTGLGGSSALVVSVLGALNHFRNEQQLDFYQLADLAYQVERIDMNMHGGWQDQYATSFGGFNWIEFNKNKVIVNPLLMRREVLLELEYNLMLFKLEGRHDSGSIQEDYIDKINKKEVDNKLIDQMKALVLKMKESLLLGQVKSFGDLLHDSWELKQKMNQSVTNAYVNKCYKIARNNGALGGKLLGAGKTGYLLIYASPLYQKSIKDSLAKKGVIQELFKFDKNGLEVWSTKR